jgi:hypothetical protein
MRRRFITLLANQSAPAFAPTDIANLAQWFDFASISSLYQDAAGTTPVTANNDHIAKVLDRSGNNRHATEGGMAGPTYKTNIQNGRAMALFDVSQLIHTFDGAPTNHSIFAVIKRVSVLASYRGIYGTGDGTTGTMTMMQLNTDKWGTYSTSNQPANTTVGTSSAVLLEMVRGGSGNGIFYVNGVADGEYDSTVGQGTKHVGGIGGQSTNSYIGEILYYAAQLNDTQRQAVEAYVNTKWALF